MEIYFQLVSDAESLAAACEELKNEPFIGFDVETTELDPYRGEVRLVQLSNGKNTKVIDLRAFGGAQWSVAGGQSAADGGIPDYVRKLRSNPDLAPLRDLLAAQRPVKIAHNAKFDCKWV